MNLFKQQTGFTLTELVVGMAIMSLIMAGTYGILAPMMTSYQYSWEQGSNIESGQEVLNLISQEIRSATTIAIPNASEIRYTVNGLNHRIYVGTTSPYANTVVYEVNVVDGVGTITRTLAANRVQILTFTQDATNHRRITIDLTLRNQAKVTAPSTQYQNTIITLNNIP